MIEWKYTNGTCLVAYCSSALAASLWSAVPITGWRQVFGSVDDEAMSSAYCFQLRPAASSWSPIVLMSVGYTQPEPCATPSASVPLFTNSEKVVQSPCVSRVGG